MAHDHRHYIYLIKHNINRYGKYIPIVGIIILILISTGKTSENKVNLDQASDSILHKLSNSYSALADSFDFSDKLQLFVTIVLLITIWTSYKYWLTNIWFIRHNSRLLEKLVIVVMFIIFLDKHFIMGSQLTYYVDWALFFLFLYLVLAGSWFLAKTIDGLNLESDLYCWGLRLLGVAAIFFGGMLFMSSAFVMVFSSSKLVFNNIYWVLSVCIMLLGAFMEFRSFRRYPMIHIW